MTIRKSQKNSRTKIKRRATAYHEAGHVVASWRLLLPFKFVTIVPTDDTLGHVLSRRLRLTNSHIEEMSPRVRDRLERKIIVLLAGSEAERLVSGRYNLVGAGVSGRYNYVDDAGVSRRYNYVDPDGDYGHALRLIGHIVADNEVRAYHAWLRVRAQNLVRGHKLAIKAVAEGLLSRGTLTEAEARRAIDAAYGVRPLGT